MSVKKLLKRIVTPELTSNEIENLRKEDTNLAEHLHDYTYGIHSDALAGFAITFSALIHDVGTYNTPVAYCSLRQQILLLTKSIVSLLLTDHQGISNNQLGIEAPDLKEKYHNKSIAEQISLDLSWNTLLMEQFAPLRQCLFPNEEEMLRFRQLIVNGTSICLFFCCIEWASLTFCIQLSITNSPTPVVLATDIFDRELNDLRKNRWQRAFSGETGGELAKAESDLRATIVIEHIIQASDVSHCMQHWHVYQKWNKKLFQELYKAFQEGRMAKDPSTFWYHGEIGFFDNYIIPLAQKLKECGVFGVSSDEYLNYAIQNRSEWATRGEEIVQSFVHSATPMLKEEREAQKAVFIFSRQLMSPWANITFSINLVNKDNNARSPQFILHLCGV